jgi:arginyl-tRNA synthetase
MYFLADLKQTIATELGLAKAVFSYPPNANLGDLSLACFELAAKEKKNPVVLAEEIAVRLGQNPALRKYLQAVKAVGPYVNFFIRPEFLATEVIGAVKEKKETYGRNDFGQGRKIMIEYSNGNTHKEYHVGHLRNISYGAAVANLLACVGSEVISVSYINDFGIHVA